MLLTKHGYNVNLINVEHLDAIFDLIEGKWEIKTLGAVNYFVYDSNIPVAEIKKHQSFLPKKFWSYRKYINGTPIKIWDAMTKEEYNIKIKQIEEAKKEEERKQRVKVQKAQKKKNADRGIYGIYYNEELIYIGKTDVDFETRFNQHKDALTSGLETQYLYKYLKEEKKKHGNISITFKPLINVKHFKIEDISDITNRDIEAIELALIQLNKPICNIQGVKQDYKFTYKR